MKIIDQIIEKFLDNHPRIFCFIVGWIAAPIVQAVLPR